MYTSEISSVGFYVKATSLEYAIVSTEYSSTSTGEKRLLSPLPPPTPNLPPPILYRALPIPTEIELLCETNLGMNR